MSNLSQNDMGEVIIQIDITYDCVSEVMDQVYLKIIVGS